MATHPPHPDHTSSSTPIPSPTPTHINTPLWAVLLLTFLGSLGTGAVTNGFSFIASQGLGYGRKMNLLLALTLGATYILGASSVGKIITRSKHSLNLSPRSLLAIVLLIIAIACQLPTLTQHLAPELLELSLWIFIFIFSTTTGLFWPIIEAYLSGGRSGKNLRTAIGRFNIVWSIALVAAFWMMAPLLDRAPFLILSMLGLFQLAIIPVLKWFPSSPPVHQHEDHEPAPDSYIPLLTIFRVLLVASYIVLSALSPLLPIVEDKLGVDVLWMTPIASVWLTSRVFMFILFERWQGWHGKWWTPWTGMLCMLIGFAGCMGSPIFLTDSSNTLAIIILIVGLAIMGMGIAMTYYGALYYAMAIGHSNQSSEPSSVANQINAGGKHEAVIGMGYTIGPTCGLIGLGASAGDPDAFRLWVIILISVAVLLSTSVGWFFIRKHASPSNTSDSVPSPH